MRGLHVHVGSQILDVEPFAESVRPGRGAGGVPGLRPRRRARRPVHLRRPAAVGRRRTSTSWSARRASTCPAEAELIIEPGRSMVAAAAATLYRVVTVKRGARTFVAVDGGMGDNLEVALFEQRFEAGIARPARRADGEASPWSGATARAATCWWTACRWPRRAVGDLVGVPATGAYCYTMAQQLQRRPPHPRGVRGRGDGARRRAARDLGGPARARRVALTPTGGTAAARCC